MKRKILTHRTISERSRMTGVCERPVRFLLSPGLLLKNLVSHAADSNAKVRLASDGM